MRRSILFVAPYLPLPASFGGALRIYHLMRHIARDHQVSLLAPGTRDQYPYLLELGKTFDVTMVPAETTARQPASGAKRMAQLRSFASGTSFTESGAYNPRMQAAMDRLFATRRIDLVQFEFPESALYRVPESVPTVFDAHNVEHDLLERVARSSASTAKRVFNQQEARKLRWLEPAIWERSTIGVATSERDAAIIRNLSSTPVDVVPNGVDLEYVRQIPATDSQAGHVTFTGAMRHQPNADGVLWYATQVHPLVQEHIPDSHFTIAGADPPAPVRALHSPTISVTGSVDDVRPYLGAAQVAVVPLWSGGGTRLKILEAFAAGRPVVSTSIGAEGLDVKDGVHLLLADSPGAFANAVVRLSQDKDLSGRIVRQARDLVQKRYGWDRQAEQLVAVHNRVFGR